MKIKHLLAGATALLGTAVMSGCAHVSDLSDLTPTTPKASASPTPLRQSARQLSGASGRVGDSSTRSYRLTSGDQVLDGFTTTPVQTAACGDGYYVRSAGVQNPGGWYGQPMNPTLEVSGQFTGTSFSSVQPIKLLGPQQWEPYQSFKASFWNGNIGKKTIKFSWWCDKVTPYFPWGEKPLGKNAGHPKPSAGTKVGEDPDIDPFGPDTFDNPEGDKSGLAFSAGSGAGGVWDNTYKLKQEGNAIFTQPWNGGSNQRWYLKSAGKVDNSPAYSFWTDGDSMVQSAWQAVERFNDPNHPVVLSHSSNYEPLPGGIWAVLGGWMGPRQNSVQIINLTSWQCATTGDTFGQITTQPCDTMNAAQWWDAT